MLGLPSVSGATLGTVAVAATVIGAAGYLVANSAAFHRGKTGFGSCTTAVEVVADMYGNGRADLRSSIGMKGKVVIVTGGTSGIGLETARAIALASATVILPVRSLERAGAALADLERSCAAAGAAPELVPMEMDLADLRTVAAFVEAVRTRYRAVDVIVCNAGIMHVPARATTLQGYEQQVGVCHLGHFALVTGLLDQLRNSHAARVVVVSSMGARLAKTPAYIESPTFDSAGGYDAWAAYGNAKMANVLFATELNDRHMKDSITAYSLHPGGIHTNLQVNTPLKTRVFWALVTPFFFKTPAQGAATSVFCATHARALLTPGAHFVDCNPVPAGQVPHADWNGDKVLRSRLWDNSEKAVAGFMQ